MKIKFGALAIVGTILSAIGVVMIVISAIFAYNDYKNYNKFVEGNIKLEEDLDYNFGFESGTVNIHKSSFDYSYIDYKIVDFYEFKVNSSDVKLESKFKLFFNLFNKNNVDLYLSENIYDNYIKLTLNAGEIISDVELVVDKMDLSLNAGKINLNVQCIDKLNINVNAGELNLNSRSNNIYVKLNAGKINMGSEFDDLDFRVNAGELYLRCLTQKDDYTINIRKNAGYCNLSNGGTGPKNIKGQINAGSVNINFAEKN